MQTAADNNEGLTRKRPAKARTWRDAGRKSAACPKSGEGGAKTRGLAAGRGSRASCPRFTRTDAPPLPLMQGNSALPTAAPGWTPESYATFHVAPPAETPLVTDIFPMSASRATPSVFPAANQLPATGEKM